MLCTWRILGNGVSQGVGQDLVCVRRRLAVLSLAVCAEFGPTDFTEFGDACCITLVTAKHILGAVLRVHNMLQLSVIYGDNKTEKTLKNR